MPNSYLDTNGLKHYTDKLKQELQANASGVASFNGRKGEVLPVRGDYTVSQITGAVPNTRTINGKPLSEDITLSPTDIGVTTPDLSGYVPTTRTINGKPLSSDITLDARHIGIIGSASNINILGVASKLKSIAIGNDAHANAIGAISIGENAISNENYSVSIGYDAISTSGFAFGRSAHATGGSSIAVGNSISSTGQYSVGIGISAHADAQRSIAIGLNANAQSLDTIVIGSDSHGHGDYSIAIGAHSWSHSANGNSISVGYEAHANEYGIAIGHTVNANGIYGIAIGNSAMTNNGYGIAIGFGANGNEIGSIAFGSNANAIESSAIAIGFLANANSRAGIAIGRYADISSAASDSVALGASAACTTPNTIQLGDSANLSKLSCKVALSVTSDERDKTDITPIGDGAVEFLNRIKAIRYVFNGRELYIPEDENLSDVDRANKSKYGMCSYDKKAHALGTKKGERVRVGVLAQEVQKALQEVYGDKSYANLVDDNFFDLDPSTIPEGVENKLSLTYENFIPFLIKAVQELSQKNEKLETRLNILENK